MTMSLRKGDDSLMSSGIVTLMSSRVMAGPLRYTPRAVVKVLEEESPVTPRGSLRMFTAAFKDGQTEGWNVGREASRQAGGFGRWTKGLMG